jgi:hypothetical protein
MEVSMMATIDSAKSYHVSSMAGPSCLLGFRYLLWILVLDFVRFISCRLLEMQIFISYYAWVLDYRFFYLSSCTAHSRDTRRMLSRSWAGFLDE